jgi:hypothetical protein
MTVLHFFHLKKFLKFWIIFLKSKKKSERGKQFKRDKEERCFFFCNFFWNKLVTREKYLTKNCQLNWKSGRFAANKKMEIFNFPKASKTASTGAKVLLKNHLLKNHLLALEETYRILKIFRDCVNSLSARFISCGRLAASAFGTEISFSSLISVEIQKNFQFHAATWKSWARSKTSSTCSSTSKEPTTAKMARFWAKFSRSWKARLKKF